MNLRAEILEDHSLANTLRLVDFIGNDEEKFAELMNLFLCEEYRICQRASWIVSYCAEKHPYLVAPYLEKMVDYCQTSVHDAVKRNTLRILQTTLLSEDLQGKVLDWAFKIIENPAEAVAIRTFALTVAFNQSKDYPELVQELKVLIESYLPHEKPAFVSRGRKILKELGRL